ncbi:hypothetical protein [Saccharospirillum impatiens]|uniref:hypothetical protein n=1 Tax=Saccharospirillum impatiens TaxID=169438 RepID=UPI00048C5107|nr:hypothetical protein [Saccharospirillum impatiens]
MAESTLELHLYFKVPSICNEAYSLVKRKKADRNSDFHGVESLRKGENDIFLTAIVSPVLSDVESIIEESGADAIAASINHDHGGKESYGYIMKAKTTHSKALSWIDNQDSARKV